MSHSDDTFDDEDFEESVDEDYTDEDDSSTVFRVFTVLVGLLIIGFAFFIYYVAHWDHDGVIAFLLGFFGAGVVAKGLRIVF